MIATDSASVPYSYNYDNDFSENFIIYLCSSLHLVGSSMLNQDLLQLYFRQHLNMLSFPHCHYIWYYVEDIQWSKCANMALYVQDRDIYQNHSFKQFLWISTKHQTHLTISDIVQHTVAHHHFVIFNAFLESVPWRTNFLSQCFPTFPKMTSTRQGHLRVVQAEGKLTSYLSGTIWVYKCSQLTVYIS